MRFKKKKKKPTSVFIPNHPYAMDNFGMKTNPMVAPALKMVINDFTANLFCCYLLNK